MNILSSCKNHTPLMFRLVLVLAANLIFVGGCANKAAAPVQTERKYSFWPQAPQEPRVQFLVSFQSSADFAKKQSAMDELLYGYQTEKVLAVAKPYGLAMWNGRIYVTDVRGVGVIVLDLRKKQMRVMGATGTGTIGKAVDIAVADDGMKYVADLGKGCIRIFDAEERFLQSFDCPGLQPVSVAVYGNEAFVVDFKAQDIKVFDRMTGKQLRVIGKAGEQDGQFVRPLKVAVDKQGNLYVSDVLRCRIQKFSRDGQLQLAWGQAGDNAGSFVRPKHMGLDSNGDIYIVDAAFNNVQVFDGKGKLIGYFGSRGRHPGAMDLPAGLTVHEADLDLFADYLHPAFEAERIVLVSNQFGPHKVAVYAIGKLKPGKTMADISPSRIKVSEGLSPATQPTTVPTTLPAVEPPAPVHVMPRGMHLPPVTQPSQP